LAEHGKNDHPGRWVGFNDETGRLHAVQRGHIDVHQNHVRPQLPRQLDGLASVLRLSYHGEIGKLANVAQALADNAVVIGY
jgi:hypothetical protein